MDYHIQREQNEIDPVKAAVDASFVALELIG
jgi:hypothetical protein